MIPPTPTPFPAPNPANLPFVPPEVRLWGYTDEAIQIWNSVGTGVTTVAQAIILLLLVGALLFMIVGYLRRIANEGEVSGG